VDSFREQTVGWVQLADGTGWWYPVIGNSFEFKLEREWSAHHGVFGNGFTFATHGYRLYGPMCSVVGIAVPR
jgi:hypothetical protein